MSRASLVSASLAAATTTRTPGPWYVGSFTVGYADDELPIVGPQGETICGVWQMGEDFDGNTDEEMFAAARKNAAFIVTACNAHDALLADRDRLRAALETIRDGMADDIAYRKCARAALAQSEKGE